MTQYLLGHATDPSESICKAFEKIAENEMKDMPFLHPDVKVGAYSFQIFEDQWIGAVLTPWMLSVFILPGSDQEWPARKVGAKMGVALPRKSMSFIVSELEGLGQYLSSSLMSPLNRKKSGQELVAIAKACIDELLLTHENGKGAPEQKERRRFMLRQVD
ncbi:MAG: [NiFe]-hydrogenase assembly chaperone HybE [Saezia sp.]